MRCAACVGYTDGWKCVGSGGVGWVCSSGGEVERVMRIGLVCDKIMRQDICYKFHNRFYFSLDVFCFRHISIFYFLKSLKIMFC